MTINKFQGKTEEEAIEKAKKEMGPGVVIMNVKLVKPKGIFRVFQTASYEVTAAMEEKEQMVNPASAMNAPLKMHGSVNLAADEKINIPLQKQEDDFIPAKAVTNRPKTVPENRLPVENNQKKIMENTIAMRDVQKNKDILSDADVIEERLDHLQNFLEKKLTGDEKQDEKSLPPEKTVLPEKKDDTEDNGGFEFVKLLYRTLLDNEVYEKYANQLLDDVMKVIKKSSSMDYILSNVYQKMILKFGQPKTISVSGKKPKVIFFIGPTGVGKTTTIAKIASKYKVEQGMKVAFLTADTYRIAATEQLRTYANILDAPLTIIYSAEEMETAVSRLADYDLVFVDTAGFSHKNELQREDTKKLIYTIESQYDTTVFLVVSATTKYRDLKEICDIYRTIANYSIIFTKLDETSVYGNIYNIKLYADADISYVTNGQNVPDDIEAFQTQEIVKKLLGGD